jgi:hypothetical protein
MSRRRRRLWLTLGAVFLEAVATWRRSGRLGGNLIVRCRRGHLFSTIWIPAVSIKSLRLGPWRFQRCPVGDHWSLVTPLRASELTKRERNQAHGQRDVRVP